VRDIEIQLKRKDGSLYYALVNIDKIEMVGGTLLLTTARDISCRKQAEEVLRKLNWSNELILTPADEGIFGLDREGKHTFVNPSASKMLGYEVRELIGKPGHTIWHHSKPDGSPYPEHESPIFMTIKDGIAHNVTGEVFWRKDSNLNNVIRETGLVPALLNRRSWPGKREVTKEQDTRYAFNPSSGRGASRDMKSETVQRKGGIRASQKSCIYSLKMVI
jgi:transcriptional regulator with PAS, ATPase and Fis domain